MIELHHISQRAKGGNDTLDNCIPLCFDCHADVGNYNSEHPKGKKFTASELKRHRDSWFTHVKALNQNSAESNPTVNQSVAGRGNFVAGRDLTVTQKLTKKNYVVPDAGGRHITDQEARRIKKEVEKYSELMKSANLDASPRDIWRRLYKHFEISSYREIPYGRADEAVKVVQIEIAKARPKIRKRNPEAWRKQYYTPIWASAGELGKSKDDVYKFAFNELNLAKEITSLKDLTQKQLQSLDRKLKENKKGHHDAAGSGRKHPSSELGVS